MRPSKRSCFRTSMATTSVAIRARGCGWSRRRSTSLPSSRCSTRTRFRRSPASFPPTLWASTEVEPRSRGGARRPDRSSRPRPSLSPRPIRGGPRSRNRRPRSSCSPVPITTISSPEPPAIQWSATSRCPSSPRRRRPASRRSRRWRRRSRSGSRRTLRRSGGWCCSTRRRSLAASWSRWRCRSQRRYTRSQG